jgi:hypothetical protein
MLLYLVASAPLFALVLCLFYRVTELRLSAVVFFHGVLSALPLLIIWWVLSVGWDMSYTPSGLYLYHLVLHMLYPLLPAVGLFSLFERRLFSERGHVVVVSMAAFLAGVYLVHAIVDVLRVPYYYGPYIAFLLPSLRLGLIALVPTLIGAASREPRPLKLLFGAGVVLVPAAFGGVALLYHLNYALLGHLLTALATALAVFSHVLLIGSYYPRRPQAFFRASDRESAVPEDPGESGQADREGSGPVTEVHPVHDG